MGDQLVLVTPDFGADFRTETISTDLGAKTKLLPTTVPEI